MSEKTNVFDEIQKDYRAMLAPLDFEALAPKLGVEAVQGEARIDFLNRRYLVSADGVVEIGGEAPWHGLSVVLYRYLLGVPDAPPVRDGLEWITYRGFPDAAPYGQGFNDTVEKTVEKAFQGKTEELRKAAGLLGATYPDLGLSHDFCAHFQALPRVPVLLLFNDADEDFPAQASVLFQRNAAQYLDMECLAIIGQKLAVELKRSVGL